MRVLLLTEEDRLYLPLSIRYILSHSEHAIEQVCCLRNPTTSSIWKTATRFLKAFGPAPLLKHGLRLVGPVVLDRLPRLNRSGRYYSVRATVESLGRQYRWVDNVNGERFLEWASGKQPDLIVSVSPTQIFKRRLLQLPRLGCLNVHSSLLPSYRGLYPVYWAMAAGETEVGVSVHFMAKGVDAGDVVLQETLPLAGMRTMHEVLVATKLLGARLMTQAIDLAARGDLRRASIDPEQGSYHSFPDRESYRRFRARGYRLW